MAKVSFGTIVVLIFTILGMVFFGTPIVATNLNAASGILIVLITSLTGIIGQYSHLVYSSDKIKDKGSNYVEHPK